MFALGKKDPKSDFSAFDPEFLAKNGAKSVSWKYFSQFLTIAVQGLARVIGGVEEVVDKGFEQIQKNARTRFLLLEKRVAELEQAKERSLADSFRGSWQPNTTYARGGLVVAHGGLWLCMADTDTRPGASDAWRLVTKGVK